MGDFPELQIGTALHGLDRLVQHHMVWTDWYSITWSGQIGTALHGLDRLVQHYMVWTDRHISTWSGQDST
jgi:hypothetical protein